MKVSNNEFCIDPMYCVSLPGYTWQCGVQYTGINLQTLQYEDLTLTLEINIHGGISSVMGDRYVKSDDNQNILYSDANNLYGHSVNQPLPYDKIEMWHGHPDPYMNKLEETINTSVHSDIVYFVEVALGYPDNLKEKQSIVRFVRENKVFKKRKYNVFMNKIKPKGFSKTKKLICDWIDKKNYFFHYRMLKLHVRQGMVVGKNHQINSFKQSKWFEKNISLNTQRRNEAKRELEKDFYKLLNKAFYGKTVDNLKIRLRLEFIKKYELKKPIEPQSKMISHGIHKSYENCDG